jgi:replicative DNA helicase
MGKINKDSLGFLGADYQRKLVNQLLVDTKFASSILDILNPNDFDDPFYRVITSIMTSAYAENEVVLDVEALKIRLANQSVNESIQEKQLAHLKQTMELECTDCLFIQEMAMKFFKQQNLKKAMKDMMEILEKGNLDDYYVIEDIIKRALEKGDNKDDSIDVTTNIEEVLKEDYRDPIPTGILGLDEIMNGGLAKGELGIVLAALGVGKTTMMTKLATSAMDNGKTVVQIFFEDLPKQIQRKHLACWSGINMSDLSLPENREKVIRINEEKKKGPGKVILKRMSSSSTTIPKIRQYLKKLISKGIRPDMVLLDYIDVVQPSQKYVDNNIAEGATMREFETMLYELDIVGWTAIQGNRSAINTEYVETDQMGGSIKKAQIGHFIMSIAKSLEQRDNATANMAILKSRFGRDGLTFEDIIFDNGTVHVELTEQSGKTFLETKEYKAEKQQESLNALLKAKDVEKGRVKSDDEPSA